jgi:adenine-specific DNA-methyltransferase
MLQDSASLARGSYGEVFTRRWVAEVMLDLVGYTADRDLGRLRLVEPSCGSGAFLVPAVERLVRSLQDGAIDEHVLSDSVVAFDLQPQNVERCRRAVAAVLERGGATTGTAARLAQRWIRTEDYLLSARANTDLLEDSQVVDADVVIGNPPYIRLEDVTDELTSSYRSRWPTMSGRADIYVGFFERALRSLEPGGRLAFICADRWMRNQYGANLRRLVGRDYSVDVVWTMHDVDAFESSVAAYPAITVLSRRRQGPAVVADTTGEFSEASARELAKWSISSESSAAAGPGYRAFRLPHWFHGEELWPSGSPMRLALIEHLNDHFRPLDNPDAGTRVGIGVATGADKVYVVDNHDVVEDDRLLPLAMVADTRSGRFAWGGRFLVNPWGPDGRIVELDRYPRLRSYLQQHKAQLTARHTAKAHPQSWYRTIDKVHHKLIPQPKLLIQDMRTAINPVLDPGGHYPHHNLYFVVSDTWDLEVLGGLLLSRVAQAFIEAYCVRMRGNTLRFQSQYLQKIRVPDPGDIATETRQALREAFRTRDVHAATAAALDAYKLEQDALS